MYNQLKGLYYIFSGAFKTRMKEGLLENMKLAGAKEEGRAIVCEGRESNSGCEQMAADNYMQD